MSSLLSRSHRPLFHLHSHYVSCLGFSLRSTKSAVRGWFHNRSSIVDRRVLTAFILSGYIKWEEVSFSDDKRKDGRFFLPGDLGQSWQVKTRDKDVLTTELVDFFNKVRTLSRPDYLV